MSYYANKVAAARIEMSRCSNFDLFGCKGELDFDAHFCESCADTLALQSDAATLERVRTIAARYMNDIGDANYTYPEGFLDDIARMLQLKGDRYS